jgi:hypothetical protein
MKKLYFVILILGLIAGCKQSMKQTEGPADMGMSQSVAPSTESAEVVKDERISVGTERNNIILPPVPQTGQQKKIIRDGSLTLKVRDIGSVRKQVDSIIMECKGYVGSESFNSYDQESTCIIAIRVPAANFDLMVKRIETGPGEVIYKDINTRDVTEEYIDLETRLANKRKFVNRYAELLKKAGTVKDMLEIEQHIRIIEEEIESTEGRLRYLNDQVSFSNLTLTLTQEKAYVYKPQQSRNFFERLRESLHKGWKGFVGFLLLMVRIWPFWILAVAGWILFRRYKKRKKITTGFKKNN